MVVNSRKEIKKRARGVLKKHYFMMVLIMLVGGILGATSSAFNNLMSFDFSYVIGDSSAEVLGKMVNGDIDGAQEIADTNLSQSANKDVSVGHVQAGRSNGIFAQVVNHVTSGSFLASIGRVIYNIVDNPSVAGIICMILALGLVALETIFIAEVFRIVIARVLLEARIYDHLNFSSFLFLIRTKKWFKASWSYLRYNVFMFLWSFTIVGGFIKYYGYAMVRYILAENPNLSGKQAIELSQRMMKGHKWELFVFDLSFIGWEFLYLLTGTLAGVFFVTPYKQIARMEFYADLRARCKEEKVPGIGVLRDEYLYEHAPKNRVEEAYKEVVEIMNSPKVEIQQPSKIRQFFQNVFGVVLFYDRHELEYRKRKSEDIRVDAFDEIIRGEAYPVRLCPTKASEGRLHLEHAYYLRHYSLTSLILIFFSFCFVGWLWEVAIHIVNDGRFVNRGVMHGPWLPIYGTGAVMILLLLNKLRSKPVLEFIAAIALCGGVEYFGSWALEKLHDGQKWWDYTGYFLNVNGRICAEGLLVFGLAGVAAVYIIAPLLDNSFLKISEKKLLPTCIILVALFIADLIYSSFVPNTGEGITDYGEEVVADCGGEIAENLPKDVK